MPRYLTPGKLYISEEVPSSSKLDVLSFIASQINPPIDHDNGSIDARLNLASSDVSVFANKLSQWQSGVPGRSVYDTLLQRIWKLDDLDSLHSLFGQLGELVIPPETESREPTVPKISRSSPLGQYIRRCVVEFTRLQFADTQALWNAFVAYRQSSYQAWATRNLEAAQSQSSTHPPWALLPTSTSATSNFTSADDTSTLLNFSIYQLQKRGARVPTPVKSTLSTWLSEQTDSSSAAESLQHFLYFFEHWRSGQYTMALESLHRYFDYSLARSTSSGQENMKVYYQYALLHLSVLHADFEAWGESVDAMEECIATARENQDTACLNFALSWLMYLRQAHPDDGETPADHVLPESWLMRLLDF
jgi:anaphase-promoting complex subunit 5